MWAPAVAKNVDRVAGRSRPLMASSASAAWRGVAALLLAGLAASAASAAPLTVCMAADNPPLSHQVGGQPRGLDMRIASAAAAALGRELVVLPFESTYEKDSALTHEVNALLSSGLCEAVSGFPLLASNLGPATRATWRTPDTPGAKRKRDRPLVTLGTLSPSRAYLGAALGVVVPGGAAPLQWLGDLGVRRMGVVSGTMAGSVAMTWRNGQLRPQLVSLTQREDVLAELAQSTGRRFDAVFLPLTLFDGWQLQHPGSTLVAAAYRRPLGINLGFVTLEGNTAVRAALDGVITQALADGSLARWAAAEGASWTPPSQPEVSRGPSLAELAAD